MEPRITIRATRPERYRNGAFPNDVSARQGHYFYGPTLAEAIAKAYAAFPGETLDIQDWSNGDDHGKVITQAAQA